jgi:hypothetical protein
MSNRGIAVKYGVARKTVDAAIPNRSRLKYSPEDVANWSAALDEGYGYKHVGEMYGVPDDTVRRYLPGRGWTLDQIQLHGRVMRRLGTPVLG